MYQGVLEFSIRPRAKLQQARCERADPEWCRPVWASSIRKKSRTAKVALAIAGSKGVHCEVESEGSSWQTSGPRTRNLR